MIQRRVKWKKGVTVENGSVQAGKGLGNSRKAGYGGAQPRACVCVCVCMLGWVGAWAAALYFRAWEGNIV